MQTAPKNSGAAPAWLWKFCFCLLGGGAYVGAVIYLSGIIPEEHANLWLVGTGGVLWLSCAWMGWRRAPFAELAAAVTGLVWGGILAFMVSIHLMGGQLAVNWPKLLAAFLIAPLLLLITVLPFWFMARKPDPPTS